MPTTITRAERRIIEALGDQQAFHLSGQIWKSGPLSAPQSVISSLERSNLIARTPGGHLRLTAAGEAHCRRRSAADLPNRMLVERLLPPQADVEDDAPSHGHPASRPAPKPRARRSVTVNLGESPLGWLMARGMISERQFAAGERLRADWTLAGLAPRVTMRWDMASGRGSGATDRSDATHVQISARRCFDAAVAHAGSGLSEILWRVICAGEGLAAAEGALGWPKRAGKLVLGLALDRIADHYGIR